MMSNTMAAAIGIGGIVFGYLFGKYQDRLLFKKEQPVETKYDALGDGMTNEAHDRS